MTELETPKNIPLLISIDRCRELLGDLARSTIYVMISRGELEAVTIGTRRMIVMQSLHRLIEQKMAQGV